MAHFFQFRIITPVPLDAATVFSHFDRTLFEKVNPPFPRANLLRYDGNAVGHEVWIELDFLFYKTRWESIITSNQQNDSEFMFIDEGKKLPFFLSKWRHIHQVVPAADAKKASLIIDQVYFFSHNTFFSVLMYPFLWLLFVYRIPQYKAYFGSIRRGIVEGT